MDELRRYLRNIPAGKVADICHVESLLAKCWHQLDTGYRASGGMTGYKLLGRTENMVWNPPFLCFTIERHGAMKFRSSRAELQHWSINIDTGNTEYSKGIRQIDARAPVLKIKPLAEKIGKQILEKIDCKELKWTEDKTYVRIVAGEVIPNNVTKQTLAGRRKRFRKDLTEFLESHGWQEVRPNYYRFMPSP